MAMQTQFVKDSKHKENSLEKIWGGLHSIDKDRNVEQRMQVLKAYHEFNHQKAQEQAKNEDRQKHALLENAKKESTLLQEYRASIADDHKRQNVLCKSRGNI